MKPEQVKELAERIVNELNEKCVLQSLEGEHLGFDPDNGYPLVEGLLKAALEQAEREAAGQGGLNELELVQLVLSAHQTAYAKFHCEEGRKVIESNDMAIGYASVELAKALATRAPRPEASTREAISDEACDRLLADMVEDECQVERLTKALEVIAALPLGHHDAKKIALAALAAQPEQEKQK